MRIHLQSQRGRIRLLRPLSLGWILLSSCSPYAAAAPPTSRSNTARDKFVEASPLIVAVACSNGVALVAAHTSDVPLLYDDDGNESEDDNNLFFRDLPVSFAGPFRLQTIGSTSSGSAAMLTAGWRSDAARLLDAARSMDDEYRDALGERCTPYTLAANLSRYMAICAGTEGLRPVSCAVLLAFGAKDADCPGGDGLWLVDATGTYPVRALCVGGGLITKEEIDATVVTMVPTADVVNQRLLQWMRKRASMSENTNQPFVAMTAEEGLSSVLELLAGRESGYDENDKKETGKPLLPKGSRLELGILGPSRLERRRVRDVWGRSRHIRRSD